MHTESPRPHTLTNFTTSLDQLRGTVLMMSSLTQRNLRNCVKGLVERDNDWCNDCIVDDEEIDILEMQIDREGIEVMSRFQPVANDLREIVSSIKIGSHIERVADQGVGIARRARKINDYPHLAEISLLDKIIHPSLSMFDDAVLSFAERNAELAMGLKIRDKEIDLINKELTETMIIRMQDEPANLNAYINLIFIIRCFERIGDLSCHIAEDVVFAIRAEDIRHSGRSM